MTHRLAATASALGSSGVSGASEGASSSRMLNELAVTGEDALALMTRLLAWEREQCPRDDLERFLVRQAATLSWRIERADHAEAALLSFHVATHAFEAQSKRLDRALELGQKLVPADAEIRNLQNDHNGYYAKRLARPEPGDDGTHMPHYSFWPHRPCGLGIRVPLLLGDDPARMVAGLEASPEGCRWLLNHWNELRRAAQAGRAWLTAELIRACRLLGRQPTQAVDDYAISDLFMACHVLSESELSPFHALRLLISPTEYESFAGRLIARNVDQRCPASKEEATALLLATVDGAIAKLNERLTAFAQAAGQPGGPAERARGSFDPGPEMAELHRLQSVLRREFLKVLEALERRKRANARERAKKSDVEPKEKEAELIDTDLSVRSTNASSVDQPKTRTPRPSFAKSAFGTHRLPVPPEPTVDPCTLIDWISSADTRPIILTENRRARDRARRAALKAWKKRSRAPVSVGFS